MKLRLTRYERLWISQHYIKPLLRDPLFRLAIVVVILCAIVVSYLI